VVQIQIDSSCATPRRYAVAIHCFSRESALRDIGVVLQQDIWGSEFGSEGAAVRRSKSILSPTAMATQSAAQRHAKKERVAYTCSDLPKNICL